MRTPRATQSPLRHLLLRARPARLAATLLWFATRLSPAPPVKAAEAIMFPFTGRVVGAGLMTGSAIAGTCTLLSRQLRPEARPERCYGIEGSMDTSRGDYVPREMIVGL